jgi:hypothetical protein
MMSQSSADPHYQFDTSYQRFKCLQFDYSTSESYPKCYQTQLTVNRPMEICAMDASRLATATTTAAVSFSVTVRASTDYAASVCLFP